MIDSHTTTNTAESGATVGFQAEQVHNSNVYVSSHDDPPEKKYLVGINYLNNGVPLRAREWIDEAIARGYEKAEVWFHWALAMLSKRSYRELTAEERVRLGRLPEQIARYPRDEWVRALEALCELLAQLDENNHRDPTSALSKLRNLPPRQREQIALHCDLVLTGGVKDSIWADTQRTARQEQHAGDRANRVWAYFEPEPMPARVRQPAPDFIAMEDRVLVVVATVLVTGAAACLGWLLLQHPTWARIGAGFLLVAAATVTVKTSFEWRYRFVRLRAKESEHSNRLRGRATSEGGFANRVEHMFQHYAHKYAPHGADRSTWLSETSGIRATLRDEIVEIYRESRIPADKVAWLIRYVIRDVRERWLDSSLFAYRQWYRISVSTRTSCLISATVAILALWQIIDATVRTSPLVTLVSVLVGAAAGRVAIPRWSEIYCGRRRFAEEEGECARELKAREAEYRRWKTKLDDTRPDEEEMESWLRCDRIVLIDETLQHYRLAWRDITAHTILQTPAKGHRRARVNGGPWRYPRYELRLFLITAEGVRELARNLDFKHGSFNGHERGHFRFDAVSSLHVTQSGYDYTLELTLSNGPTRNIEVTEPKRPPELVKLDEPGLAQTSLDATGFTHALHVLEGIAAEGKAWIQHEAIKNQSASTPSEGDVAASFPGSGADQNTRRAGDGRADAAPRNGTLGDALVTVEKPR